MGLVAHSSNASAWEAEAGEKQVWGQLVLHESGEKEKTHNDWHLYGVPWDGLIMCAMCNDQTRGTSIPIALAFQHVFIMGTQTFLLPLYEMHNN